MGARTQLATCRTSGETLLSEEREREGGRSRVVIVCVALVRVWCLPTGLQWNGGSNDGFNGGEQGAQKTIVDFWKKHPSAEGNL